MSSNIDAADFKESVYEMLEAGESVTHVSDRHYAML